MDLSNYARYTFVEYLNGNEPVTTRQGWLGLFSTPVGDDGSGTEAAGGSYSRQLVEAALWGDHGAQSTDALMFSGMPAGTWTHAGIFAASSGDALLFHTPLVTPKTTVAGQNLPIDIGDVAWNFTGPLTSDGTDLIYELFLMATIPDIPTVTEIQLSLLLDGGNIEITGGGYAPQELVLTLLSGGAETTYNAGLITFSDVQTGGLDIDWAEVTILPDNIVIMSGPLVVPVPDPEGDVVLDYGDFALTLS